VKGREWFWRRTKKKVYIGMYRSEMGGETLKIDTDRNV